MATTSPRRERMRASKMMTPRDYEATELPLRLLHDHCAFVEPIRPSGFTESGLYVLDQEGTFASQTSMLVRAIGIGPNCCLRLGAVYLVPVYAWDDLVYEGEKLHVIDDRSAKAEVAGYDDE